MKITAISDTGEEKKMEALGEEVKPGEQEKLDSELEMEKQEIDGGGLETEI